MNVCRYTMVILVHTFDPEVALLRYILFEGKYINYASKSGNVNKCMFSLPDSYRTGMCKYV